MFVGSTDYFLEFGFSVARLYDHEMKNVVFPLYLLGFIAAVSIMIPGIGLILESSRAKINWQP